MKFKLPYLLPTAVLSAVVALFFTFVIPLQTFLSSRDMFDFSAGDVSFAALPFTILTALVLFAVLAVSGKFIGRSLHVIVTAVLLCGYFETGIFSAGLPPLNGDLHAFANPFRVAIDSALLGVVFLVVVGLYKWIKPFFHWVALGVLVMSGASLFDAVKPVEGDTASSGLSKGFCPQYDVVKSLRFSPNRNVVLLILDTFRASMASEALRRCPGLKSHFNGFTVYENNLSMHETTCRALPALMTGKFLPKDMSTSDFENTMFGPDSLLNPYVDAGCSVYFSDQLLSYGYTNRRLGDFSKISSGLNKTGNVFYRNSNGIPYITLLDTVRFRFAPYKFKCGILGKACVDAMVKSSANGTHEEVFYEDQLYKGLILNPVAVETNAALTVLHTSGVHGPIYLDANGKRLATPSQDIEDYNEYSVYVLKQVAALMDHFRKAGIYDKSTIVIAADHGLDDVNRKDGLTKHGADDSVLWVKPAAGSGDLKFSGIPTSNMRLCELFKALVDKDLSKSEIEHVLRASDRRFYAKFGVTWYSFGRRLFFYEWRYDDSGKVISLENMGVYKAN